MASDEQAPPTTRPTRSRRKLLVDPRFQYMYFRICFWTGLMLVSVAILMYAALKLFFSINEDLHPFIVRLLIGIPIFIGVFTVVFGYITVRMTHRVAGPAFGLERSIQRLRQGQLEETIRVRNDDYLKNLAGALEDLRCDMTWQRGQIESLQSSLQKVRDEASGEEREEAAMAYECSMALLKSKSSGSRS